MNSLELRITRRFFGNDQPKSTTLQLPWQRGWVEQGIRKTFLKIAQARGEPGIFLCFFVYFLLDYSATAPLKALGKHGMFGKQESET